MRDINSLSLGILLTIGITVLSACGQDKFITDAYTSVEKISGESITEQSEFGLESDSSLHPQENSDEVLKVMEMPLDDGRVLILSVIGKKRDDDIVMYGVREIRVFEGNLIQSILIQEAIDMDGVNGIDKGYSECLSIEESAALKDVNFDGYMDLEVCGWIPNNSVPYYYWCWNNDTQQYEYSFCLQLSKVDVENKRLIAWYKVENGLYYTDYYRVNDKNQLELIDREIEDVRP